MPGRFDVHQIRVSVWLNWGMGAAFLLGSILVVLLVNQMMRRQALVEAENKARLLLDRNLATHYYFSHHLKPALFELTEPVMDWDDFDPVWMSSTYAVREMLKIFHDLNDEKYYYKEAAVNARSPENEADEFEREFIEALNQDPGLVTTTVLREFEGEPYFVLLRRAETMEESCLRCHSDPARAPGGLVSVYGSERSFGRQVGEVVSAISIRIPLARAYRTADRFSLLLSGFLVGVLIFLFGAQLLLTRQLLVYPLDRIREKAAQIARHEEQLGEQVPPPLLGRELKELAEAFNKMSLALRQERDMLETRIQNRTQELEQVNRELGEELSRRKQAEARLQAALAERELLVKDTFHRVKNNLMVIDALLFLQSSEVDDPRVKELFRESQARVKTMLLIHKQLHSASDLVQIHFSDYLHDLVHALFEAYNIQPGQVRLTTRIEDVALSANTATSLGMILNELISNALKHAFKHQMKGELEITLRRLPEDGGADGGYELRVKDTGGGLPEGFDPLQSESLGMKIVLLKVQDLGGELQVQVNGGTAFQITFRD